MRRALLHVTRSARAPERTLFVPEVVRSTVLRWGHSSKLMAHPGIRGTLAAISQRFWWPTRERNVRRFVASCQVCAQTKSSNSPPAGLLRPLPIPSRPWSHIALDFVTGLPLSAGNTVILTVVDRFSKAAHFPFECCLGYQPPLFASQESQSSVPSVERFIQRCKRTWRRVRSALCRTRTRTRRAANRHRVRSPRYVCGQKVWLSTRNLPIQEGSRKLMPRFVGPFSIVKVLSPVAIKLRLSRQLRHVHPVFHVSYVKPVFRWP